MDWTGVLARRLMAALGAGGGGLERSAVRELVRARMEAAMPRIARGMRAKGLTPDRAEATPLVRDALFRLWRAVLPSGDLADFVRDAQDDAVVARVAPQFGPETPLRDVVRLTLEAALEVAF